jgi:hypothetical protein
MPAFPTFSTKRLSEYLPGAPGDAFVIVGVSYQGFGDLFDAIKQAGTDLNNASQAVDEIAKGIKTAENALCPEYKGSKK